MGGVGGVAGGGTGEWGLRSVGVQCAVWIMSSAVPFLKYVIGGGRLICLRWYIEERLVGD